MKASWGIITSEDVGRNGFTRKDVGKYYIICGITNCVYIRDTETKAQDLANVLNLF